MIIRNIKLSAKLDCVGSLNSVCEHLETENVLFTKYPSYITFYKSFNFILFKKSKNNTNHVNITKLNSEDQIDTAINVLSNLLSCTVLKCTIDNITATHDFKKEIDLGYLYKNNIFACVRYNAERFPGMFVKEENGSAIVFHSGKLVLLGCKTTSQICLLIKSVTTKMNF